MKKINKSKALRKRLVGLESIWDKSRFAVRRRLGLLGQPIIQPFRGFGDKTLFWVRARVIEDRGVTADPGDNGLLPNIRMTIKRYLTREIPGAAVEWTFGSQTGRVVADEEGYIDFEFEPGSDFDPDSAWQPVTLQLADNRVPQSKPIAAQVLVRTPGDQARLGIISDIDDTIVETGAFDFVKHWRTVVANSAQSRVAFADVPALYGRLAEGAAGPETNPVFYVSSSPWNLFDLFERFMQLNDIPVGPMMLKDFGMTEAKWLTGGHQNHKRAMIDTIMDSYPGLRFVLCGDSGQRDAEIYAQIIEDRPERVCAALIRTVGGVTRSDGLERLEQACAKHEIVFFCGTGLPDVEGLLDQIEQKTGEPVREHAPAS